MQRTISFVLCGFFAAATGCVSERNTTRAEEPVDNGRRAKAPVSVPNESVVVETEGDADADNTRQNRGDDAAGAVTPEDQSNSVSDVEITRRIRRALTTDDSLSVYGQNVKIITQSGNVVLRGPVRSASERSTIEATARRIAGAGNVTSDLQIAH